MFKTIYSQELLYWLKKPSTYLYIILFSGISFLGFVGTAGLFDPHTANNELQRYVNSPFEINNMFQYLNKLFLFLLPAIIGASIYKDYKYGVHSILYSYPMKKQFYFFGRFLAAFTVVVIVVLCVGVTLLFAEQLPGLDPAKMGDFNLMGYLQLYVVYTLPNMLFYGALVYAVVVTFRNIYAAFVILISLFFLQIIGENTLTDIWIAIFDPFAQHTVAYITQEWTLQEQNTYVTPLDGAIIYNRMLWGFITGIIFYLSYKRFALHEFTKKVGWKRKSKPMSSGELAPIKKQIEITKVHSNFSYWEQWKGSLRMSLFQLRYILKSPMFFVIGFLGILAVLFAIGKVTNASHMAMLPFTGLILSLPAFFFTTIIMLLTFIYTGMLVHWERNVGMHQLVDTTPSSSFSLMVSKIVAIVWMQMILLAILWVAGVIIQLYNGYYQFEWGVYFFQLYGIQFLMLLNWIFLSLFVHTLFKNTYVGIFLLLIFWLGIGGLEQIGITTRLLTFNAFEPLTYSGLNGYGNALNSFWITQSYWLVFGGFLVLFAYLLWYRGFPDHLKERVQWAFKRYTGKCQIMTSLLLVAFVVLGFTIYSKEDLLLETSTKIQNQQLKEFKSRYGDFSRKPQPKITDISLHVDLFPKDRSFVAKGSYVLVNKTKEVIDTLLIKTGYDEVTTFEIQTEHRIISRDSVFQFSVVGLENGLRPSDTLLLAFQVKNKPNTLFERNSNVLRNGTFLLGDFLPRLGYFLDEKIVKAPDSLNVTFPFGSMDSDVVNMVTTVSTEKDQIAIAPGHLTAHWEKENRSYFSYELDQKSKFAFGINSGRFSEKRERYQGTNLVLLYDEDHAENLDKMMSGLKAAIEYNTEHFSAYHNREVRIVEYPLSEGSYATLLANNMPTSELRFLANTKVEEGRIDIAFYVAAHEMTHSWWGNQIIPANALGARFISESTTDYLTYRMYEKEYGVQEGHKWLKMQRNRYLEGRKKLQKEPALVDVNEEQAVFYGKGTLALNAMRHYLGTHKLHEALKEFLNTYSSKQDIYPTAPDLIKEMYKATPDSLHYMVHDLFETVTFYEITPIHGVTKATKEGFETSVGLQCEKKRNKLEVSVPLNDFIQVGLYDEDDDLISISTHKITKRDEEIKIHSSRKPTRIQIDPNLLLIQKNIRNNNYTLDHEN